MKMTTVVPQDDICNDANNIAIIRHFVACSSWRMPCTQKICLLSLDVSSQVKYATYFIFNKSRKLDFTRKQKESASENERVAKRSISERLVSLN
jgi:hypothetical protein